MSRSEHLVSVEELAVTLGMVRLLDVRWSLAEAPGQGQARYAAGHLPGARFLDLERVLTARTGDPREGRHPLPDMGTLERGLGALGVSAGDDLVVYDEPGSFAAERAWWVLRWAGLAARVLDGGLPAWVAGGGTLETGRPESPAATKPELKPESMPTLDLDHAAAFPRSGVLLDARAPERYRGEVEPLDPRAGHIPGARNAPAATLYSPDRRMPADAELRELLPVADEPVAAYCGSGVSAARNVLALAVLGVDAALFPGSWSAWSNDPARPAASGAEPGDPSGTTLDSRR